MTPDAHPTVKVARDLTEIIEAHERLRARAVDHAASHLMPGGEAMAALGPVANLEAWEHLTSAGEVLGRAYTSAVDEDPEEHWSAAQLIEFWSEAWRRERDAEWDMRRDITTEAKFLKHSLDWAWDHELHFEDFARDVRQARLRLENLLKEGERSERARVVCDRCETGRRLVKVYGHADDGSEDHHRCPGCKYRFDRGAFRDALARQMRSEGAERMVPLPDAVGTLKAQGRPERTIRKWLGECMVTAYCDVSSRRTLVWWPDLWRLHLTTQKRERTERTTSA